MKEFLLNNIIATGTTVGDLYFPQTKLLLPFDGTNGVTATSDLSNSNIPITFNTSDTISTAQSKFGGSSAYVTNNIEAASSDGFNMGTGEFTYEGWFYLTSLSNSFSFFDQWSTNASGNFQIWQSTAASGKIRWYYSGNSLLESTTTLSINQWYHLAFVRSSGVLKMYFNGTADASTLSFSSQYGKTGSLWMGWQHTNSSGTPLYYIDDIRVTKGVARYTSNFTPPTTAHLTSAGDVNKQILINSTADGVAIGTGGINQARISKAWVEFDGSGITINASYNVSSITDHGNRDYTINFSTAMTDAYYSIVGSNIGQTSTYNWSVVTGMGTAKTASAARINVPHINDSSLYANDPDTVNIIVFGN
jgi:hypothetical protein